jgi:hypothetical protein
MRQEGKRNILFADTDARAVPKRHDRIKPIVFKTLITQPSLRNELVGAVE